MSTISLEEIRTLRVDRPAHGLWEAIGNTPLIRLNSIASNLPEGVEIYAKVEWFNPGGSIKDRPAAGILSQAIAAGKLENGRVFLDSTSGNMGIAYATLASALGIPIHLAIPANASHERLSILRSLGAALTLTDPSEGSDGARLVAAQMADQAPQKYYYADQYSHPANWQAHFRTTGPEVYSQTAGRVTHFVAGLGTTGTITGAGRYLRQKLPEIELIGIQPDSPLHGLEGLKHLASSEVPPIFDPDIPDEIFEIQTEQAYAMARRLAAEEGLLAGPSAAAAAAGALRLAPALSSGVIVVIFPDSGLKYLSQPFWESS